MTLKFFCISLVLVTFSISSEAQNIVTDRPDQAEAGSLVPMGSLQIESGVMMAYFNNPLGSYRQFITPNTLFRYGLTNGIEIRVVSQMESTKNISENTSTEGISDLQLGAKINLLDKEDGNAQMCLLSHVILPSGTSSITNGTYGSINKLCYSSGLTENLGLGVNLGYDYSGSGSGTGTYAVSLAVSVTEKAGFFIEQYAELAELEDFISNFDGGFTYLIRNNLQFDFSFGTGLNHHMNFLSMGMSWNISE